MVAVSSSPRLKSLSIQIEGAMLSSLDLVDLDLFDLVGFGAVGVSLGVTCAAKKL